MEVQNKLSFDFIPLEQMLRRAKASKDESDTAYFYDLMTIGEMVTKFATLFLVANIEDDVDRTRYRYEYRLVRADGIGVYADIITDIAIGSAANYLPRCVRDVEIVELNSKLNDGTWQLDAVCNLNSCLDTLGIAGNALSKKSSLKIWFSNFSILRNKTKGHGSITPTQCSNVIGKLEDALSPIIENFSVFKRNWAHLYQNMNGKYRVSCFANRTAEFDYLKSSREYKFQSGVYLYTDSPRFVPLLKSDAELTKFLIVNGNFGGDRQFELHDYYLNLNEKCDGSAYLEPPQRLPDSITGGSKLSVVGNSFTNLPIGQEEYIQRTELEDELRKVLLDENRYPIVTLKGRGGIGKTSLALYVISDILRHNSDRFDIVIWFSARDIDLTPDGPKQVQAVVINQQDISVEYFKQIGNERKSQKEVVEDFSKELTNNSLGKALYVFDNFETLSYPVEVYEWLNTFIRNPNKILITSRLNRNFKADYPLDVKGMTEEQCRELIDSTAKRLEIVDLLSEGYINNLIEESDGHPYVIKIILGEVLKNGKATEIKRIVAAKDKVLDALFKRTYATLSIAAKRVFLTLSSWHSLIPYIALESVIMRSENEDMDFDATIDELEKSSLIEIAERKDDLFISVPLAAAIFGLQELDVSPMKIQIMSDRQLLMEFGAGNARGKATLEAHITKKVKALKDRIKSYDDFVHELPSMEYLSSKYPQIWNDIAFFYNKFGIVEKEKECYRELLKVERVQKKRLDLWKRLRDICYNNQDWDGESSALLEIVNLPSVSYDEISYAAYRVNKYYSDNSANDDLSKNYLIKAIIIKMEGRIKEANAQDCSRLAWLFLNMQDEPNALKYARMGLERDRDNQHCRKLVDKLSM